MAKRPTSTTERPTAHDDRPRKKTAAPPVPGRTTTLRKAQGGKKIAQKTARAGTMGSATSKASRTRSTATATARLGFSDVESASRYLLSRGEALVVDGVLPRLPIDVYLDALVPVLRFINQRAALFAEANLGPEVCAAAEAIAHELQGETDQQVETVRRRQELTMAKEQEAVTTGALLLTVYRDAIRRVARGPRGQAVREHFGVADEVDTRDPQQLAAGMERFLQGAQRHPEYVQDAGLSPKQLDGLAAQRRVILARVRYKYQAGALAADQRLLVLHASLEYFFDRYSAAVSAKLFEQPEERVRGLKLVPRARDRT